VSNDSWVEADYSETQIGRMKVGDPVRIDAPGTGPYPLAGRPAGACHRSAGRRSLFGWRTQPTRFGGFLLVGQLKEIYIDGELEMVDTTNWFPKVLRKDFTVGMVVSENGLDDPDQNFYENYACGAARNC